MRIQVKIVLALVLVGACVLILLGVLRGEHEAPKEQSVAAAPVLAVPPPSCPPVTEAAGGATERPVVPEVLDTQALQAAIRQIVREELQTSRQAEARQAGLPSRAAPAPPSAESTEALHKTRGLVHNALSTRYWGTEQVAAMSELLPKLTPEQREEVFKELVPALNSGDIEVAVEGSLF